MKKIFRFFETFGKSNKQQFNPKTTLASSLIAAAAALIIMSGIYYFIEDVKYLVVGILVCAALIGMGIYSYFKEKKDNRKAIEHNKIFKDNRKFQNTKWREKFYDYKSRDVFEVPDKRGMKYDLKKRYRTKDNFSTVALGLLFIFLSIFLIIYQPTATNIGLSIFGILFGTAFAAWGMSAFTARPVREFYRRNCDFEALEKSYRKGKMLSYKDNGINLGTTHIMVYTKNNIYAIDYRIIYSVVKKMVRVKKYENNLYTGDEYRYCVEIMVKMPSGSQTKIDVELDEYQCEMLINEYRKAHYSYENSNKVAEKIDSTVSF